MQISTNPATTFPALLLDVGIHPQGALHTHYLSLISAFLVFQFSYPFLGMFSENATEMPSFTFNLLGIFESG